MIVTATLWQREMVRFLRQRHRIIGALATPIIFWLLLGFGLDKVFVPMAGDTQIGYLTYFLPGTLVMILLFTAIFSVISVIEDRREGFLQGVLVSPAKRSEIVMGKVLGGATLATGQAMVLLALWLMTKWLMAKEFPGFAKIGELILAMFIIAVGLTALGLALAWPMRSTAGFHAIMNLLLLPMWFLSGAVFPMDSTPSWMKLVMTINPLTYANAWVSVIMLGDDSPAAKGVSMSVARVVSLVFAIAMIGWCIRRASRVSNSGR